MMIQISSSMMMNNIMKKQRISCISSHHIMSMSTSATTANDIPTKSIGFIGLGFMGDGMVGTSSLFVI